MFKTKEEVIAGTDNDKQRIFQACRARKRAELGLSSSPSSMNE